MIRRICLFGGASCGKSTMAARIFADMKASGYNIELVVEFIKTWVHEKKQPQSWDQLYVFGHQMHREDVVLRSGVELIVTDSPLLMNVSYSTYYGFEGCEEITDLAAKFDKKYPSINFLLPRKYPFVQEGRYQSEEENKQIDAHIKHMMTENLSPDGTYLEDMPYEQLLATIKKEIKY